MALVVETGALVLAAVSYITVAEARAYAAARGLTLPATDAALEPLIVLAADYLEQLEDRFQGSRVSATQAMAWPREYVYIRGEALDIAVIPNELKMAQCQLAVDAVTTPLQPTGTGREIVRQKVDVIETEYGKTGSGSVIPEFNKAMAYLTVLFSTATSPGSLTILRV